MQASIRAPTFLTTRGTFPERGAAERRLIKAAVMNTEFEPESAEQEAPHSSGFLTGWEVIVFQVEDEPESDFSTAVIAPCDRPWSAPNRTKDMVLSAPVVSAGHAAAATSPNRVVSAADALHRNRTIRPGKRRRPCPGGSTDEFMGVARHLVRTSVRPVL